VSYSKTSISSGNLTVGSSRINAVLVLEGEVGEVSVESGRFDDVQ